ERHSDSGLGTTSISHMLISFGSVPSSGRPDFETTVSTSGIFASAARNFAVIDCASVTDTDEGSVTLIQIEPSLSSGRNSVPSFGTTAKLAASAASAVPITIFLQPTAHTSTGS